MSRDAEAPGRVSYCLFDTPIGACGVAWSDRGLTRLILPEPDRDATERRLRASGADPVAAPPPPMVARAIADVRRHLEGTPVDFSSVPLDLEGTSPFHRRVYDAARGVRRGETVSYGELAHRAGSPRAARAVGQALARNPIAIIIPCHRILAGGRKLGGFTAFGGTATKECLLSLEDVQIGTSSDSPRGPASDRRPTAKTGRPTSSDAS